MSGVKLSPALVVTAGNVLIQNIDLTTATDAPTILVTGGNLTLRNDIVQGGPSGIRMFGLNNDVTIDGNRVNGARQALQLPAGVTATPYSAGTVGAQ